MKILKTLIKFTLLLTGIILLLIITTNINKTKEFNEKEEMQNQLNILVEKENNY